MFSKIRIFILTLMMGALASCSTGTKIENIEDFSIVYGWVGFSKAPVNNLSYATFRNYNLPEGQNVYSAGIQKMGDGILVFHVGMKPGPVKISTVEGQFCLGIISCGRINVFDFGTQGGEVGSAIVPSKSISYLGTWEIVKDFELIDIKRQFHVQPASQAPTRSQMLRHILTKVQDNPEVTARVQKELNVLKGR